MGRSAGGHGFHGCLGAIGGRFPQARIVFWVHNRCIYTKQRGEIMYHQETCLVNTKPSPSLCRLLTDGHDMTASLLLLLFHKVSVASSVPLPALQAFCLTVTWAKTNTKKAQKDRSLGDIYSLIIPELGDWNTEKCLVQLCWFAAKQWIVFWLCTSLFFLPGNWSYYFTKNVKWMNTGHF